MPAKKLTLKKRIVEKQIKKAYIPSVKRGAKGDLEIDFKRITPRQRQCLLELFEVNESISDQAFEAARKKYNAEQIEKFDSFCKEVAAKKADPTYLLFSESRNCVSCGSQLRGGAWNGISCHTCYSMSK